LETGTVKVAVPLLLGVMVCVGAKLAPVLAFLSAIRPLRILPNDGVTVIVVVATA